MRKFPKLFEKKVTLIPTASYFFSLITTLQQFFDPNNDGNRFLTLIAILSYFSTLITTGSYFLTLMTTQHSETIMKGSIRVEKQLVVVIGVKNSLISLLGSKIDSRRY